MAELRDCDCDCDCELTADALPRTFAATRLAVSGARSTGGTGYRPFQASSFRILVNAQVIPPRAAYDRLRAAAQLWLLMSLTPPMHLLRRSRNSGARQAHPNGDATAAFDRVSAAESSCFWRKRKEVLAFFSFL